MKEGYIIREQEKAHFITATVVDWIDVFTRKNYRDCIIECFDYCIKNKGMILYGYVVMSNHIHMIIQSNDGKLPLYFYHPDHLGTSTFLTDFNGNAYQFFLNLPFGETMAEQLGSNYYNTPYKFNGKELDEETGLYYYGARYYDPRVSIWLSTDPLAEKNPDENSYIYCGQNPVVFIDPDGRDRIYSSSGILMKDTKVGSKIWVDTKNGRRSLSGLDYTKKGTRFATARIMAKEASLRGYKGYYGVTSMKDEETGAYTNNAKTVVVNTKQLSKGTYDDYHDLGSTLDHEASLKYGHKGENIPEKSYTYLDHAKVYLGQSQEGDFKYTSEQNQYSTAVGFATRIFASTQKENGLNISEQINMYNSNNGSVKIDNINTNNGTAIINVNGQTENVKLKIPATPHD